MSMQRPFRPLIIIILVVLLLAMLYFTLLLFGQSSLTRYVNEEVDGLELVSLHLSPFIGEVEAENITYSDGNMSVKADVAVVRVSAAELFDMVFGSRELSSVSVLIDRLSVSDEQVSLTLDTAVVNGKGRILLTDVNESLLTQLSVDITQLAAESSQGMGLIEARRIVTEGFGHWQPIGEITGLEEVISSAERISVIIEGPQIILSADFKDQLASTLPLSSWLTETDSWKGEELRASFLFSQEKVVLEKGVLAFPVIEAEISGEYYPADPTRIKALLRVSHLSDAIRREMNALLYLFFLSIPEGAFVFELDTTNAAAPPRIVLEPIS